MNIILVIIDSLRKDHIGAYGNEWIFTPHLDTFAGESVVFTRAYPDSLPTLPVRRALHTGIRTFPFRGHRDFKGDFSGAPGWGPIPEEQDTLAEILKNSGYRSGFITDCYHQFKPSKNFHRGFDEWIWIRGQEHDRYKSGPQVDVQEVGRFLKHPVEEDPAMAAFLRKYLTNNVDRRAEQDYYPARLFMEASRWVWDNQDAKRIFMVVDSFDPHEPWDPPSYYRKMYDPRDDCVNMIQPIYGPWRGELSPRELRRLQANYAGEVTLVDRWFGYYYETLRLTGRLEDSLVAVISDHGFNIGFDPGDKGLLSKQGHPMTRAVADLVLMIRHPKGEYAGTHCDKLAYNHDLTATLLSLAGIEPTQELDGVDIWPVIGNKGIEARKHVTVAWGPLVTVINDRWWYNADIWGKEPLLYDLQKDPWLEENLAEEHSDVCEQLRTLAIEDAGGEIPDYFSEFSKKPGCTPYYVFDRSQKEKAAREIL